MGQKLLNDGQKCGCEGIAQGVGYEIARWQNAPAGIIAADNRLNLDRFTELFNVP